MTTILYENSFASHEKAAYWSDKNAIKPNEVKKGSNKNYLFNCDKCGHEFLKQINLITKLDGWCSYCSNNKLCDDSNCKICFDKSFASNDKSLYWSNKNDLKPRQVFKNRPTKFIFDCSVCKHEFAMSPNVITSSNCWCSYCSNKHLCNDEKCEICFNKSFASHEKSLLWSNKNELNPRQVFKSSTSNSYWFDCNTCEHDFCSTLANINKGQWCPYCCVPQKKLCGSKDCDNCYNKSFASHEKSKYWSNKNELNPRQVFKSSSRLYWFDCNTCEHDFCNTLANINNGQWCPCCNSKILCNKETCMLCYNKSFASHEKSKYWSNKNKLNPRQVSKSSNKSFLFDCDKCNHEFASLLNNVNRKDQWCPYCNSNNLCNKETCMFCYNKSFASHEKAKYWSTKNIISAREIVKGTNNSYIFNCDKCPHEFLQSICAITGQNKWCAYCTHQKLCDDTECSMCFNNSFASHPKSIYWTSQNLVKPRDVFSKTHKKYWFNCDKCNLDFYSSLREVSSGCWCPFCVNKTETKIYTILKERYPSLLCQFKKDWCKNITFLPFDFCIPEYKIIIELDGPQHFRQISNWSSPEEQLDKDKYKEKCANDNDYSVIRLIQEDVFYDRYDWLKELCSRIEEIKNGDEIMNVYLCRNGEYDTY